MSFLDLCGKRFVVFGLANKKSVAYAIAKTLVEEGAEVVHVVRGEEQRTTARKLFPDAHVFLCDVEKDQDIKRVCDELTALVGSSKNGKVDGLVHSIAFANYSDGFKPFHETNRQDFLQAVNISCFSLVNIVNHCKDLLAHDASVITISISTTRMAAENYGYMAPIKAALNSSVCFLAKSFSAFSKVRFNAVAPGLLKTSASAGIPGYIDSYLFAEKVIPRHEALTTQEVANTATFLLSPRSSGINAQILVVDAGMEINYFDKEIVRTVSS